MQKICCDCNQPFKALYSNHTRCITCVHKKNARTRKNQVQKKHMLKPMCEVCNVNYPMTYKKICIGCLEKCDPCKFCKTKFYPPDVTYRFNDDTKACGSCKSYKYRQCWVCDETYVHKGQSENMCPSCSKINHNLFDTYDEDTNLFRHGFKVKVTYTFDHFNMGGYDSDPDDTFESEKTTTEYLKLAKVIKNKDIDNDGNIINPKLLRLYEKSGSRSEKNWTIVSAIVVEDKRLIDLGE